jgi:hypothetical protein
MEEDTQSSGLGESQQNLNDLQSYLVNFNKEIGVHGEGSAFHHSVSQIISQSTQPVFVTLPGILFLKSGGVRGSDSRSR